MEGGLTKPRGFHVSKTCALFLAFLMLVLIASALLLMYLLAPCPCARNEILHKRHQKPYPTNVRLPRSVVPHHYSIKLIPFLYPDNFTFTGRVVITCNVTMPTYNITLHSSELKIHETNLSRLTMEAIMDSDRNDADLLLPIKSTEFDKEREFYIIYPKGLLTPGGYKISISFTGVLNDALQGFYRSSYTVNNVTKWIAATQFQSTDARKAFPCFDEPALKAKFSIQIGRLKNMTSISNMPKTKNTEQVLDMPDYVWDQYIESVPMSTYLVAFVVSDFEHLSQGTFHVWVRPEAIDQARYALDIGPKILQYFESYFQIPYPLQKMDMIALPDFAAGAMENWGLITFRENTMLFQYGVSTNRDKQRVASVVSHELAHQWFGNLVTPSWWSDIWLNEGFATYVEYLGVDVVEPEWRTIDQFVVSDLQNVLQHDAYKSSHPVSASVSHPNEIDEIFDTISYEKGASIIRMMNHFLTTPVFKRGLTNYLNGRKFQSATQDDLWQALTEQAHLDNALEPDITVKKIMDTWTLKTGYPLITVTRNYKTGSALVSQKRFQYGNMDKAPGSDWWVPLSYTTQPKVEYATTNPLYWLKAENSIVIDNLKADPNHWVLFNINQTGFYRVNYDEKNWEMITAQLKNPSRFKKIGELNRAQILDDSLHLAYAGVINYSVALNITTYLSEETSYLPWASAFPAFNDIRKMIDKMPIYDKFKKYLLHLITKLYDETNFDDNLTDPQLVVYKRVEVFRWACKLGIEKCLRHSVTQFHNWRISPDPTKHNPISPNMKGTVYCNALREGGQIEWDFAWEMYLKTNVISEKVLLLSALGCTRETWLLSRYLHWAVTEDSGIRKQDGATVFSTVASNQIGQSLAFAFVRDNWKKIKQFFGPTAFTLDAIIRSTTSHMNTEYDLKMLKEFAEVNYNDLIEQSKAIEQSIEIVENKINWMKNNYGQVEKWLNEFSSV
ncbi:aminopeptidase N-like [Cimex lectularius]|uniref:Aminopeptidase n=1 Tax=Cimex lectularius TaxID=79782 RepID=A0A8I6S351_CIMLE|nr:aminopeptidase N-like [Cimex lectularius]